MGNRRKLYFSIFCLFPIYSVSIFIHSPMPFVFTADDFGQSEIANRNILDLVRLGKIQRVSIMVNGRFSKGDARELLNSKVKLDLHLTIPLLSRSESQETSVGRRSAQFAYFYLSGRTGTKKIETIWEGQIKKFNEIFGKTPDGLNSHEHTHFFPPYFKITLKLCKKYKIPFIRCGSKNILGNGSKIGSILKMLNRLDKKYLTNRELRITSYQLRVTSYDYVISLDWISNLKKFLKDPPRGTIELAFHPEREEEYRLIHDL